MNKTTLATILLFIIFILRFSINSEAQTEFEKLNSEVQSNKCHEEHIYLQADDFNVTELAFVPQQSSNRTIIILPPAGGMSIFDKFYARIFCHAHYNVFILEHWSGDDEKSLDLQLEQRLLERSQQAISLAIKKASPTNYIGILGTSLGGIYGSLASCLFKEVDAVFSILGGGSLPSIMADSALPEVKEIRKSRFKKFGFKNRQEYIDALDRQIHLDAFKIGTGFENKKLGMVISTKDRIVPTKNQRLLKKMWKPTTIFYFHFSHTTSAILTALFRARSILNFFNDAEFVAPDLSDIQIKSTFDYTKSLNPELALDAATN